MPYMCECNSTKCSREVQLGLNEAQRIQREGLVLIVADCSTGPEASDELAEDHGEYKLFREVS
jgi:hypothetical protein